MKNATFNLCKICLVLGILGILFSLGTANGKDVPIPASIIVAGSIIGLAILSRD